MEQKDQKNKINLYDFDGVTNIGVTPRPGDIIITGRTIDEYSVVYDYLNSIDMINKVIVYFNPINYEKRGDHTLESRTYSGVHKANIISNLLDNSVEIGFYFEDDELQAKIVLENTKLKEKQLIMIKSTVEL